MQRQAVIGPHGHLLAVRVAERLAGRRVGAQPDPADRDLLGHDHGTGTGGNRASGQSGYPREPTPVDHLAPPLPPYPPLAAMTGASVPTLGGRPPEPPEVARSADLATGRSVTPQ